MKLILLTLTTVALATISPAAAQTNISSGHWDISAHLHTPADTNQPSLLEIEFGTHIGTNHVTVTSPTFIYNFGTNSPVAINNTLLYGTNSPVATNNTLLYVSPEDEIAADNSAMPFIGFSAEELASPFTGTVTFTMTGFTYTGSGTGNFYLFEGTSLFWDSRAGVGNYGSFSVNVGFHEHGEFGFSDLGLYEITLVASGNNGATVTSSPTTLNINVVPEPSTGVLLMAGLATLSAVRRRTRR